MALFQEHVQSEAWMSTKQQIDTVMAFAINPQMYIAAWETVMHKFTTLHFENIVFKMYFLCAFLVG